MDEESVALQHRRAAEAHEEAAGRHDEAAADALAHGDVEGAAGNFLMRSSSVSSPKMNASSPP